MSSDRIMLSRQLLATVWREVVHGKSLPRTFLNYSLSGLSLSGHVLDLGSRSNTASYHRFLKQDGVVKITYTDLYQSGNGIIQMDLEKDFPISSDSVDTVTCFNTLEHIFDFKNLIAESFRILKPGGRYIGGTPFLVNYHPDPYDYFRYSEETIERLFIDAGFQKEKIVFLGFGPFTASVSLCLHAFPRFLRGVIAWKAVLLDWIILRKKTSQRGVYALGYMYIFRKPLQ